MNFRRDHHGIIWTRIDATTNSTNNVLFLTGIFGTVTLALNNLFRAACVFA